jgi:hypothetical protein
MRFRNPVSPGEEIFIYYSSSWFADRELKERVDSDPGFNSYGMEKLQDVGQCLTKLNLSLSDIPSIGKGVFATTLIRKGELVQVTPVLIIPKHEAEMMSDIDSVLLNYCISSPGSDLAILPLALAAMCNHGGNSSNAAIEWFFWDDDSRSLLDKDPQTLLEEYAGKLYLGYRATRDIQEGDEVVIDYGESWWQDWEEFSDRRATFALFEDEFPLFRRAIDAPVGLFPDHWMVDCIGFGADCRDQHDEL